MPSALIGFAFFKAIGKHLKMPFSPVENVLVQTVASSMGTMPLGCGFVGVIPALEYLLFPSENGPLRLELGKLVLWAVGICLFGVVIAVPLRREVIIREKLKFPTGTATALMIGVLHGDKGDAVVLEQGDGSSRSSAEERHHAEGQYRRRSAERHTRQSSAERHTTRRLSPSPEESAQDVALLTGRGRSPARGGNDWQAKIRIIAIAFVGSVVYVSSKSFASFYDTTDSHAQTVTSYFVPQLRNVPFLGLYLAENWLWTLNLRYNLTLLISLKGHL